MVIGKREGFTTGSCAAAAALFILSGYAHSIALAGYAAIARGIAWWVIPLAAAGNGIGSYLIRFLLTWEKKKHE